MSCGKDKSVCVLSYVFYQPTLQCNDRTLQHQNFSHSISVLGQRHQLWYLEYESWRVGGGPFPPKQTCAFCVLHRNDLLPR